MNYKQHLVFGVCCSVVGDLVIQYFSTDFSDVGKVVYFGTAGLGSLLPDIDHPNSFLGRRTWGWLIPHPERQEIAWKIHRKFTHSLAFTVCTAGITLIAGFPIMALGLSIGTISHLLGDMMTPSGVPLLYPIKKKYKLPVQINTRFR